MSWIVRIDGAVDSAILGCLSMMAARCGGMFTARSISPFCSAAEAVAAALREEVAADRPVHVSFLTPEEFAARPELIRTKTNLLPPGLEIVRVIDIEGLDRQADGGTHVARTGEVGVVHVVGHQSKGKGNKRLRIALDPIPPAPPRSE